MSASPREKQDKDGKDKPKTFTTTTQIARPYFTNEEIKYLHSKTISDMNAYNQRKSQIFQFLFNITNKMKFPIKVLETAMTYYQRYFLFNKFSSSDIYEVGTTCLFLSVKNEDTIKKLKDIITVGNGIRDIPNSNENVDTIRKQVLNIEKKLLEITNFNFLNYSVLDILVKFCKKLKFNFNHSYFCYIMYFDSFQTETSLKVPAHCIALAIIIISTRLKIPNLTKRDQANTPEFEAYLKSLKINPKSFNCPGKLVNEALFEMLDFYINFFSSSYLSQFAKFDKEFIDIKVEFSKLEGLKELPKVDIAKDEFLDIKDYNVSMMGTARFMLGSKRRRFNREIE